MKNDEFLKIEESARKAKKSTNKSIAERAIQKFNNKNERLKKKK